MEYVRVSIYKFKSGMADEVIRKGVEELYPRFKQSPGFISYDLVKTRADAGLSVSYWESAEEAEAALQQAGDWMRDNFGPMLESAENHVGELTFSSRA